MRVRVTSHLPRAQLGQGAPRVARIEHFGYVRNGIEVCFLGVYC